MGVRIRMDRRALASALMREAAADALNQAAEVLLEEANQTVPIEEHTLEISGTVGPASASDLTAMVGYNTPYAVRQHEETTWRHDEGRTAKWLENAARDFAPRFERWVGAAMRARTP